MERPQAHWLPDGRRLHLHHGPIDLIIEAFGVDDEVHASYRQAAERFETVLEELVQELPELRRPAYLNSPRSFLSPIAQRMEAAVSPLANVFLTPMAAVAGSVADEMLATLVAGRTLRKAYVNNGGDCALHLDEHESLSVAIAGTGSGLSDRVEIAGNSRVRGVATSGWRGRSHSLGIADAVTVIAPTAAMADAAATVIANQVDLPGNSSIKRVPARLLAPDSDLGDVPVTVDVGGLLPKEIDAALDAGLVTAKALRDRQLIEGAALFLAGRSQVAWSTAQSCKIVVGEGGAL